MRSEKLANALALAAAGQYVADKLPFVPPRMAPGPLAGRMLFGALCGALVAKPQSRSAAMVAGTIAAAGATYLGFHLRRKITRDGVKDWPVALAEDAIAMGLAAGGVALIRR